MKRNNEKAKKPPRPPRKKSKTGPRRKRNGPQAVRFDPERSVQAEVVQQRYQDLVEGLDSTIVWEMGAETFQFTFVSQRAEILLGYPLEQWYTDPTFWQDKLHPEDRKNVLDLFNSALEEATDQRCDHRMVASDGRVMWFHTGLRPVYEEGGTSMLRGLSVDMTAQKEAQEAIRRSQERYETLVNSIEGTVWEADAETFRFQFVSKQAEEQLGYPPELWIKNPSFWKDHIYPEDRERVTALWIKGVAEGTGFDAIYRMVTAEGPTLWIRNIAGVSTEPGRSRTLRGLIVDISERVRVETALRQKTEEAEEANRVKSGFLSMASHEIRTPLNAIVGYASLLKGGEVDHHAEKRKEIYERIDRNAKELLDLINRILDFNKIEAGQMDLGARASELSLSEMVQQVLRDLRPLWEGKGLALTFIDDPDLPPIHSDPGKLRQIFTNLIANAVKFTEQGSITVRLLHDAEQKTVSVEINDTGVGIPENELSRIFEPYFQAERLRARSASGTGLGLSIVKKFVEYLGGSIDVASAPGTGSTFTVTLPYGGA